MTDDRYERAKKRVKKKRELYANFTSWIITCSVLLFINLKTSPWHLWVIYPFLGWGISVAFQAYEVYGPTSKLDWEEREIEREMNRMRSRDQYANTRNDRRAPHRNEEELELKDMPKMWNDKDFV